MRKLFGFLFLLMLFMSYFPWIGISGESSSTNKRVLMIIAPDRFRDEELSIPKQILEENGYEVVVASEDRRQVVGMLGMRVIPDIRLDEVNVDNFCAVILVGGVGVQAYFDDKLVHKIVKDAYLKSKIIGAICLAPVVLAKAQLLSGKKASVWPSEAGVLKRLGAQYIPNSVVIDGNVITASGPDKANLFARKIVELLQKKDNRNKELDEGEE